MSCSQYDVLVVGAGCAGLTAAIGLARAGFTVAVLEAAPFPGSANWSGCVYDTRHLAHPDILGPEGVEQLAWERRLIERGRFLSDGQRLLGLTYRDAEAFSPSYLVLRPLFDHSLAQAAIRAGASLLCGTTVESLIRAEGRVVGVCTQRGPLYADLVFLAEGDASQLLAREGYERSTDPRDAPRFLHAIKQVIELPPGVIEERFGVGPEQGVAYDFLLRNGTLHGQVVPLNLTGFLVTNRQSLSVGLMLPSERLNLFEGSSPRLLDWLLSQPALQSWWADGRRGTVGARLLRAGGETPYLADAGLVIGGAAAGMGTHIPALDFIGPATWTGLLLVQAACRIRAEGGGFTREQLARHYLEPLRQSACWQDAVFFQRWPGYLRRSRGLFTRSLDLTLGAADVWMSPQSLAVKLLRWCRLLAEPGWSGWMDLRSDTLALGWALRLRDVMTRPRLGWVLFNGLLNSLRDLLRHPRANLPAGGRLHVHYQGPASWGSQPPPVLRRWFGRIRPILEAAARLLYRSEPRPFSAKITAVSGLLVQQLNLFDLLAAGMLALVSLVGTLLLAGMRALFRLLLRRPAVVPPSPVPAYDGAPGSRPAPDAQPPLSNPGIHVLWPRGLPDYHVVHEQGLEQICPAGVFTLQPRSAVPIQVHAQRCIQCETCWRVSPLVDWARDPQRRLIFPVVSPVLSRLLRAQDAAGLVQPTGPRQVDPWTALVSPQALSLDDSRKAQLAGLLDHLEHRLEELDRALEREPAIVDRGRGEHLEMLVRAAHALAQEALAQVAAIASAPAMSLARELVARSEERLRRTWEGRLSWAAADGRNIRQHHLTGLRRLLGIAPFPRAPTASASIRTADLLRRSTESIGPVSAEQTAAVGCLIAALGARCLVAEVLGHAKPTAEEALCHALAADLRRSAASCVRELQEPTEQLQQETLSDLLHLLTAGNVTRDAARSEYTRLGRHLLDGGEIAESPLHEQRRHYLQAEHEEMMRAQRRLEDLIREWRERPPAPNEMSDEIVECLGREAAAQKGGRLLLDWIDQRLEKGDDAELETVLLRVWLDEREVALGALTSLVRRRLQGIPWPGDRPLVEPDVPPPERTLSAYLAAPLSSSPGDFLLAPVDLSRPRLVPELTLRGQEKGVRGQEKGVESPRSPDEDLRLLLDRLTKQEASEETVFIAGAVASDRIGRRLRRDAAPLELEEACAEVVLRELMLETDLWAGESSSHIPPHSVHAQLAVLDGIVAQVLPRLQQRPGPPRHLGHEALELESLRAAWRQSVQRAGDVFQSGRWENPAVQISCLALAAATAWLLAADNVLGRLAWLDRAALEEDAIPPGREAGLLALARCHATVRDALHRFEEDLTALRRGYVAPHLRVGPLLEPAGSDRPLLLSDIHEPLAILVLIEPEPILLPTADGEQVLELYWDLDSSDSAALENALRLRQSAPDLVRLHVAAIGPRRSGQLLRRLHSLDIEDIDLLIQDDPAGSSEQVATALVSIVKQTGPFNLLLAGDRPLPRDRQLAHLVADRLALPLAGHASTVAVQGEQLVLAGRGRPLPAAVLVQPGLTLRPFEIAGYLHGLRSSPRVHSP